MRPAAPDRRVTTSHLSGTSVAASPPVGRSLPQEAHVILEINTDNYVHANEQLRTKVEAMVAGAIDRFADRVSRVQVHLGDENSDAKGGANDKRCMIEARLDGRPPIAVTHKAPTLEQAMDGAAEKLERSIDSMLGRLRDR
jgi:ribosome-associated translation inhibitor RaiA